MATALGVGLELLDDRWRSHDEAEQLSQSLTFGFVPKLETPEGPEEKAKRMGRAALFRSRWVAGRRRMQKTGRSLGLTDHPITSILEPTGMSAEAYRTLPTNLLYTAVDDQHPKDRYDNEHQIPRG